MAYSSRVTSKGQVTIPITIRRRLGLKQGDRLEFVADGDRTVIRPLRDSENPFSKYVGILGDFPGGVAEINAWIREVRDDDETEEG